MVTFALRWSALAVAALFAVISWSSWRSGEPPPWSMFAPRIEAVVLESNIASGRVSSGAMRHAPVVRVDADGHAVEVVGLQPSFYDYDLADAEDIVDDFPEGAPVTLRRVGDKVMADRIDLFQTGHALFMSLMTLVIGLIGLLMSKVFTTPPRPAG